MLKSYPDDINSQIKGCRNMGHFAYDGTCLHAVLQGIVYLSHHDIRYNTSLYKKNQNMFHILFYSKFIITQGYIR